MNDYNKPKVIAVVGPTASGKTALSVEIAKRFDGEVISADSMQIYKGMDIATAKPTAEEMQGIKHHLVDFFPAQSLFSVAAYVDLAHKAISEVLLKDKLPVIAGGTGLYVDNLLSGTSFTEGETDFALRAELQARLDNNGLDSLLDELKSIDTQSFEKLSVERNPKRIIRALEIFKTTGITMTEQNKLSKPSDAPYESVRIGLDFKERSKLYDRINMRVDLMLEAGLLNEAESFFKTDASNTAVQAIGYKELEPYFKSGAPLEECIDSLKQATRRYAKRQLTWFRRDKTTNWFFVDEYKSSDELIKAVTDFLITKGFDLK
ncbi:MAG: tRNA (adenosine(37)-N6)-dimethylallyltransferase MiaA [Clostridia bacterium]|nr:tRNA (adenosine(37)-N6)-dimethylallyltransferase MiaA [Clostridia bacterium]